MLSETRNGPVPGAGGVNISYVPCLAFWCHEEMDQLTIA
jgi:hypothetical protein